MDSSVIELRLQQWKPIFEAQAKSGLGKDEWCEKNGIRRWEFYRRQRELRQYLLKEMPPDGKPEAGAADLPAVPEAFVELPMVSKAPAEIIPGREQVPGDIEISHGKFKIRLKGNVDGAMLESIIKAVAHA